MKKLFIYGMLSLLCACTTLEYDKEKISLDSDVDLLYINSTTAIRERDGQVLLQISGTSGEDQTVYYKVEWFDINGMKISTSLAQWKKVNLREDAEFFWKVVSPSPRDATYRVYITDNIGDGIIE